MEYIKSSACPTYVKRGRNVQLLKSVSLPTGILNELDLVVYDYDLQDGDILVMCTDGVIDSNKEYLNKQLWLRYLLEDLETDDAQKIADIIIKEAIDNDYYYISPKVIKLSENDYIEKNYHDNSNETYLEDVLGGK